MQHYVQILAPLMVVKTFCLELDESGEYNRMGSLLHCYAIILVRRKNRCRNRAKDARDVDGGLIACPGSEFGQRLRALNRIVLSALVCRFSFTDRCDGGNDNVAEGSVTGCETEVGF